MRILFIAVFYWCLSANVNAQESKLLIMNATNLDDNRYEEYKGSPYFLKDWNTINIVSTGGSMIEGVNGNYNGKQGEFEVYHEEKFISLPEKLYPEVNINVEHDKNLLAEYGKEVKFLYDVHPKLKEHYSILIFSNDDLRVFEKFYIIESESKTNTPGQTIVQKKFSKNSQYYFIVDGKADMVKLTKKSLLKYFKSNKKMSQALSDKKLKLKTSQELKNILQANL